MVHLQVCELDHLHPKRQRVVSNTTGAVDTAPLNLRCLGDAALVCYRALETLGVTLSKSATTATQPLLCVAQSYERPIAPTSCRATSVERCYGLPFCGLPPVSPLKSSLQRHPHLRSTSAGYAGKRLLEEFSFPHAEDGADVARAYPWLAAWDGGCPASEYASYEPPKAP